IASLSLFIEPQDGYEPVIHEISTAKHSLDMAMYLLTDKKIIDALIEAKQRGVNVRVILEKNVYGEDSANQHTCDTLKKAGVKVKWSNPAFFSLTHEKAFAIDQKQLVIMTLNQTYSAYHHNREYGAIDFNASDLMEFTKEFDGDWENLYPEVTVQDLVWGPNNASGKLIQLLKSVKDSLYVEAEEINNKAIENLLIQQAHRGIDVRVIVPPQKHKENIIHLVNNHVHVRIMNKKPMYLHAKLIIVDDSKGFIGSENFSAYSLQMNRELGILIYPHDHLQRLTQTFNKDWKTAAPNLKPLSQATRHTRRQYR
ncbi:MAG: hypothetical protein KDH94_05540, partial [Coxiellaceae bacterium]|nr:hypothetical protein [Coxiellaceae bacterium]